MPAPPHLLWRLAIKYLPKPLWAGAPWRAILRALPKQEALRILSARFPGTREREGGLELAQAIGAVEESFMTFHLRPRSAGAVETPPSRWLTYPRTGIILQGPLLLPDDFTLETIKLYRRHFSDQPVILSTWSDEPPEALRACEAAGAILVIKDAPANPGPSNINRQIVSTRAGLAKCAELGVEYAVKSRTDLRMYNPNALAFLHSLLLAFPLGQVEHQRRRIAGLGLNTLKYRRYGLSDLFLFGATEDLERYWACPLDPREAAPDAPFGAHAELRLCEVYLEANYLESIGRPLAWTVADSWRALAEHFCIVDAQSLDLYWQKYDLHREFRRLDYRGENTGQEISFADWLTLKSGAWVPSDLAESATKLDWNSPVPL